MAVKNEDRIYEMTVILMDGTRFLFYDTLDVLSDKLESFREMGMRKANLKLSRK